MTAGDGSAADLAELASPSLAVLGRFADPEIDGLLDLGAARAAVSSALGPELVTVISTGTDTGEIGSALGDLGYEDRGGVLGAADSGSPAFRLEDGLVFVATDPALLRDVPDEPSEDPPSPLLAELDGPALTAARGPACTGGYGTVTEADGSGEIAYLVEEGPDLERLTVADSSAIDFGEPVVDDDLITVSVAVDADVGVPAPAQASGLLLVGYDC